MGRARGPGRAGPAPHLAALGPASVRDVQQWSAPTRLRAHLEALRPHLAVLRDDHGTELLDLPDAPRPDPETPDAGACSRSRQPPPLARRPHPRPARRPPAPPVDRRQRRPAPRRPGTAGLRHHAREGDRATLTGRPSPRMPTSPASPRRPAASLRCSTRRPRNTRS
ncbi:DNA glycosylase AlkZ-like family protein [Streptomyces albidoflavus]